METKKIQKVWGPLIKGSILPLMIGLIIFAMSKIIDRYGMYRRAYIDKVFISLVILVVTYWIFKIAVVLFRWYAVNIAAKTKSDLDDKFIPLFRRVTVTFIWVIGLIILLSKLGVNINALVATLGVGSLAIALAAQDTIANVIAGFLIMVDRPFCVGNDIKLPSGEKVKVIAIGTRRSKFISQEKAIIIVPNLELSKSKIVNYSYAEDDKII